VIDVAIAAAGASWEPAAIAAVESSEHLRLTRRCVDVAELLAVARTGIATVAVVEPTLPGLDVDVVREIAAGGAVVASCGDPAAAAALGIVRRPAPHELAAVDWSQPAPVPRPPGTPSGAGPARDGRLVTVWGPAGAPGRSTLALAVASVAAAEGRSTVLLDADVGGGTQAQQVGVLDDLSGLLAACRAAGNGRADEVLDHLVTVEPRFSLLTGLPRPDQWVHLRVGAVDTVLERVRGAHELVVADVGAGLDLDGTVGRSRHAVTRHLVEAADALVVVGLGDPVGLARLVRGLDDLREVRAAGPDVLVVNQLRSGPGWGEGPVTETLRRLTGRTPDVFLPADHTLLDTAVMSGRSVRETSPGALLVRRVHDLVATLVPGPAVVASPRPE